MNIWEDVNYISILKKEYLENIETPLYNYEMAKTRTSGPSVADGAATLSERQKPRSLYLQGRGLDPRVGTAGRPASILPELVSRAACSLRAGSTGHGGMGAHLWRTWIAGGFLSSVSLNLTKARFL